MKIFLANENMSLIKCKHFYQILLLFSNHTVGLTKIHTSFSRELYRMINRKRASKIWKLVTTDKSKNSF